MYADKKPGKVDQNEQRLSKWLNCALSNEPLKRPIVRIRVTGSKRKIDVKAAKVSGKIETNGKVVNGKNEAKRFKAADLEPANANKEVYASIFTSSRKSDFKETYSCRSLPLGRN
ncbi:putative replication termination factor 2 [Helianthus annuus]|nr:putative replication termination factor 2 [Helianthus annuus]